LAADFSESVDHVAPTFVESLSDGNPLVYKNAYYTLGHLDAAEATGVVEETAHGDVDVNVRKRAA